MENFYTSSRASVSARWQELSLATGSGVVLFYPIRYDSARIEEVEKAIEGGSFVTSRKQLYLWEPEKELPDSEIMRNLMLPYVAGQLLPSKEGICRAWRLQSMFQEAPWYLMLANQEPLFLFSAESIRFMLYTFGIGLLEITLEPQQELSLGIWLEMLHFLRGEGEATFQIQGQHPPFAGKESRFTLASFARQVLPIGEALYVRDRFIPYSYTFVREVPIEKSHEKEILYRIRSFFPPSRAVYMPEYGSLFLNRHNTLPYAQNSYFVASLEGMGYVAFNPSEQFATDVRASLRSIYLMIFRLVLLQHFYLLHLSQDVLKNWSSSAYFARKVKIFRYTMHQYLNFISTALISQIFHRERHHRVYIFIQRAMEIPRLHRRVYNSLREVSGYIEEENLRHLQRLINAFGILIGVPSVAFAFLSINIFGITSKDEGIAWEWALLVLVGSLILGGVIFLGWMVIPAYLQKLRRLRNPIRFEKAWVKGRKER